MTTSENIVAQEKVQLDFSNNMSYGDYLQIDTILSAQKPLSPAHDEMLDSDWADQVGKKVKNGKPQRALELAALMRGSVGI